MKETTNNNNKNENENENNRDTEGNTTNNSTEEKFQKGLFHYRSFLESVYEATEGETPDLDELYEIIELFSSLSSSFCEKEGDCSFENISEKLKKLVSRYNHHDAETKGSDNNNNNNSNGSDDENDDIKSDWNIMIDLLLSNTYFHLGDFCISQFLLQQDNEQLKQQQQDKSSLMDLDHHEEKNDYENPEDLLQKSLKYFPYNASCLSMLANFYRICPSKKPSDTAAIMSLLKDDDDKTTTMKENKASENNENNNVELICQIYERASTCARKIRCLGLDILSDNDDGETEKENNEPENEDLMLIKECIELLLLDGAAGVTYVGDDDDEEDEEEDEDEGDETKTTSPPPKKLKVMELNNNKDDDEQKKETEEEEYSISQVDATSSFMAGLLNSLIGKHDEALVYLKKFNFSHRLHPNVWKKAIDLGTPSTKEEKDNKKETVLGEQSISSFKPHFEPKSFYNKEQKKADYFTAGVLPDKLYKRMCQVFSPSSNFWKESEYQHRGYFSFFEDIVCNEKKEMEIKHLIDEVVLNHLLPIVQKELTENDDESSFKKKIVGYEWWCHTRKAGANLGHQTHATKAYISKPRNNSFMIFPGNLLHGVLPCRPINSGTSNNDSSDSSSSSSSSSGCDSRLTFMIGFWTRSVPEKMKNRKLYGPCSALPNADDATTTGQQAKWVEEIQNGYKSNNTKKDNSNISTKETSTIKPRALPTVAPAWEEITTPNNNDNTEELSLSNIPKVLDHRFFVHDAPTCFRESLFNDDDDDNDDDEC